MSPSQQLEHLSNVTGASLPGEAAVAAGPGPGPAPAAPRRRRRIGRIAIDGAYPVLFSVAIVVIWQVVVSVFDVSSLILPSPIEVFNALVDEWSTISANVWPTLSETVLGFGLAAVIGVGTAVLIVSVPAIEKMIYPILVGSLVVPKVAVAPLFVVWFGFGATPKVLIVFLIAFFPVVVDMALGLRSVPDDMITLVRSMGASRWRTFWKIRFVSALPNMFVGLKVAMALAVVGAIVGEFVQSSEGLGYLLIRANTNLLTDQFFAVIVVLTAMGVLLYLAVDVAERFVLRNRR